MRIILGLIACSLSCIALADNPFNTQNEVMAHYNDPSVCAVQADGSRTCTDREASSDKTEMWFLSITKLNCSAAGPSNWNCAGYEDIHGVNLNSLQPVWGPEGNFQFVINR